MKKEGRLVAGGRGRQENKWTLSLPIISSFIRSRSTSVLILSIFGNVMRLSDKITQI